MELLPKNFRIIEFLLAPFGYFTTGILIGISIIPSIIIYTLIDFRFAIYPILILILKISFVGVLYFVFGFFLLFNIIIFRNILRLRSKSTTINKIDTEIFHFTAYHGLLALAEFFILPLIRGTIFINYFYRGMGAKIGKYTCINTTKISDCNLISIGENCIIGGDAIINGHSGENNILYRNKVIIGNNVTIGTRATILCGAVIEDNVTLGPNSLVLKNQVLKANSTYIGVPARIYKTNTKNV